MWIKLALSGSLVYVPESLARVHVQRESLSSWNLADGARLHAADDRAPSRHPSKPVVAKHQTRSCPRARLHKIGLIACTHGDL